jgi:hypothetical protein
MKRIGLLLRQRLPGPQVDVAAEVGAVAPEAEHAEARLADAQDIEAAVVREKSSS